MKVKMFFLIILVLAVAFSQPAEAKAVEIDLAYARYGVDIPDDARQVRLTSGRFVLELKRKKVFKERLCYVQHIKATGVRHLKFREHPVNFFRPMFDLNFHTDETFIKEAREMARTKGKGSRRVVDPKDVPKETRRFERFAARYSKTTGICILPMDAETHQKVREVRIGDVVRLSGEIFKHKDSWTDGRKDPHCQYSGITNYFYLRDIDVVSRMDGALAQTDEDEIFFKEENGASSRKAAALAMHPAVLVAGLFLLGAAAVFYFKA